MANSRGGMPYWPRYPADYAMDTGHLTLAEHGAYGKLLDRYYLDGSLPTDVQRLFNVCSTRDEQERNAVTKVVAEFFVVEGDRLIHRRVERELAAYRAKRDAAVVAGKASGEKRKRTGVERKATGVERPLNSVQRISTNQNQNQNVLLASPSGDARVQEGGLVDLGTTPTPGGAARANGKAVTAELWEAFTVAYQQRYGVKPLRDAKANSVMLRVHHRLGGEGPAVARFYVHHDGQLYVRSKHDLTLLLRDAAGLLTECRSGRTVTDAEARQADRTRATANAFFPEGR